MDSHSTTTKPKVLAIDDNPGNLLILSKGLKQEYEFLSATNGRDGLDLAIKYKPELILLDVMMPEMTGYDVFQALRQSAELYDIPVIFITGLSDYGSELVGLKMGAADYIIKPFKMELVRHRISRLLLQRSLLHELKVSEERLRLVLDTVGEGVWDWDISGNVVAHNTAWCAMFGLDKTFMSHEVEFFLMLVHPDDRPSVELAIDACIKHGSPYVREFRVRHADGNYIWVSDRGNVIRRDEKGEPARMVGSITNIDDRKRAEDDIYRLAFFDSLTGLPNRRLMLDRLTQAIIKNQRSMQIGAVMFIDLDHFKELNDTHGHAMGDSLLIQVGKRIQECLRAQDTVSRFGGDEFVVMLESISADRDIAATNAEGVGRKILEVLNQSYQLGLLSYFSTPSIGITLFGDDGDTIDAILQRADQAMYEAKSIGRNTIKSF